jgi:hypothetical protein
MEMTTEILTMALNPPQSMVHMLKKHKMATPTKYSTISREAKTKSKRNLIFNGSSTRSSDKAYEAKRTHIKNSQINLSTKLMTNI